MNEYNKEDFAETFMKRMNTFWTGVITAALIILPPAIYSNQAQMNFIELQRSVIELHNEKSLLQEGLNKSDLVAQPSKQVSTVSPYDPAYLLETKFVSTNGSIDVDGIRNHCADESCFNNLHALAIEYLKLKGSN